MVIRILSSVAVVAVVGFGLCVSWFLIQDPSLPATDNPFSQIANVIGKIAAPFGAILFLVLSRSAFKDASGAKQTTSTERRNQMWARNFAWLTLVLGLMYVVYALGAHGVFALFT